MRDWLNSMLGEESGRIAQIALGFLTVILLILLLAWIARRLLPGARLIGTVGNKQRKRLGVLEASDVDARRRLVLVRRDDVEHLIMIGGPNDILIESRIMRAGAPTVARPNVQQMPRPGTQSDTERLVPPVAAGADSVPVSTPPTHSGPMISGQTAASTAALIPTASNGFSQPQILAPEKQKEEDAPRPVRPPLPQLVTPPYLPSSQKAGIAATTQPAAVTPSGLSDQRRPSLNDLINAASLAKSPVAAPTPPMSLQPDLEEDDRDTPTQIVPHRAPAPSGQSVRPSLPASAKPQPQEALPAQDEPTNRAIEVTNQIERALADLNLQAKSSPPQEPAIRPQIVTRQPIVGSGTVPSVLPPAAAVGSVVNEVTAIPPRPVVPPRPVTLDRPIPLPRQQGVGEIPEPARIVSTDHPEQTADRMQPTPSIYPPVTAEPVTAPRPVMAPSQRPAPASVAPEPTMAPEPPARQKVDELEEEMAKLLSELGGTSTR